ncbi:MAG: ribosome-associated translation inhibitor RaiA [Patescibacteria group bacterium]
MRVNIRHKDIEITDSLREYLNMKIVRPVERLQKRAGADDALILDIEVARTTRHHHKGEVYRASATLALAGKTIRASAEDTEIHAACDALEDELKREITHYKTSSFSVLKRLGRRTKQLIRINPAAWFRRGGRDWHEGN